MILVLVLLGFLWWWIVQPHGHDALGRDAQLPLFSVRTPGSSLRVIGVGARRTNTAPAQPPARPDVVPVPAPARPAPSNGAAAAVSPVSSNGSSAAASTSPGAHRPVAGVRHHPRAQAAAESTSAANGDGQGMGAEELKWAPRAQPTPSNGTVEFLPGRLDVVQGRGVAGQEVRFVRPARPGERAVVTFGRGEGPLYRHVQLNVPTVSRLHARLSLDAAAGGWAVENLSSTNPTVLNGEELPPGDAPRPLRDGDRLEMGEVVFTYHVR